MLLPLEMDVVSPRHFNASNPFTSPAMRLKSFSMPVFLELTKSRLLVVSRDALSPCSPSALVSSSSVVEALTLMDALVPSPLSTLMVPSPPVYPSSASVVPVFAVEESLPPVRYPDWATLKIFNVCVPVTAVFDAEIDALVGSDTVVFFRL